MTRQLFHRSPSSASFVRRLWFDGFYGAETSAIIFEILPHCTALDFVTLPWTALRYGTPVDWAHLLGRNPTGRSISSLELLAVNLKQSQMTSPANQNDHNPLDSANVDFGRLRRLKIFGESNFLPLVDDDLVKIARTAKNMHEIHVTGTASVTIHGVMALVDSSHDSLRVLEHSPLSQDGFDHPEAPLTLSRRRNPSFCHELLQCSRLTTLSISLPSLHATLFQNHSVAWDGEVQIRTASLCNSFTSTSITATTTTTDFQHILDTARNLMRHRRQQGAILDIELFIRALAPSPPPHLPPPLSSNSLPHPTLSLIQLSPSFNSLPHPTLSLIQLSSSFNFSLLSNFSSSSNILFPSLLFSSLSTLHPCPFPLSHRRAKPLLTYSPTYLLLFSSKQKTTFSPLTTPSCISIPLWALRSRTACGLPSRPYRAKDRMDIQAYMANQQKKNKKERKKKTIGGPGDRIPASRKKIFGRV